MRLSAIQVIFTGLISVGADSYYNPKGLYPILPIEVFDADNNACRNDSRKVEEGLKNNTLWAYKMWESSAKDGIGITEGQMYQLGNFDECVDVQGPIKTQYCLVDIQIKLKRNYTVVDPFSLNFDPYESVYERIQYNADPNQVRRDVAHLGICTPASCSRNGTQESIKRYFAKKYNDKNVTYKATIEDGNCYTKEEMTLDAKDIGFCIIVILLVLVVLFCTTKDFMYDEQEEKAKSKGKKLLLCFSARQNYLELTQMEGEGSLNIIYVIKIVMMVGVIMGHSIVNTLTGPVANYGSLEKVNRNVLSMMIARGEVVVDMFFLLSGLLVTYTYFLQEEKRSTNPIRSVVLRYFRLVPVFAFLTYFYASIYYKLGTGPLWNKIVGAEARNCQKNWWTNLLLINNFVDVDHLCILQAWYIPCDFHLFVIAIPINMLIKKNRKIGLGFLSFLIGISLMIPFLITYIGNKPPFYYIFNDYFITLRHNDVFQTMYVPTYTRSSPYFIGMLMGYGYYKLRSTKFQIPMLSSCVLFLIGCLVAATAVFSGAVFYNPYRPYTVLDGALYAALHRSAFALGTGIVLLIATHGSIPAFKYIANWTPVVPIGKLTYGGYMSHMIFQYARVGSSRMARTVNTVTWAENSTADTFYALVVAFFLYLLIENPIYKFAKELLPANKKQETTITEVYSTKI